MAQKKITVVQGQTGKRWQIAIEGADKKLLAKLQWAIKAAARDEGAQIVNGAPVFGSENEQVGPTATGPGSGDA